jgi:dTDP-4-dehydrorhamnose reductase
MLRKIKLLITGAGGTLAGYAPKIFSSYELILANRDMVDVTNFKQVTAVFQDIKPDIVIHLAAKTDVDLCEKQPELAYEVNGIGTKNIAEASKRNHIKLCYVSTAAVFDGVKSSFTESDKTNPVNEYGKSKLAGEKFILDICQDYLIVRIPWLIGGGIKEKKFISYILKQIQVAADLHVVNDTFGNLAYAPTVLNFIRNCIEKSRIGLFHFASKTKCSRYEIARKIIQLTGKRISITPVSSSYFQAHFFSPRPKHEVIYSEKMPLTETWQDMLESYYRTELSTLV